MKIYKFLLYYFIIQLVYKIIISEKNIENDILNDNINCIFKKEFKYNFKYEKYNIKDTTIQNNKYYSDEENDIKYYFNKKNKNLKKKLNNMYTSFLEKKEKIIKNNNHILIEKDKIILNDNNIKNLKNNKLNYTFYVKKNFLYKINFMSKIITNNIIDVKLLINNSNKKFEYQFYKNYFFEKNIENFNFIIDNNSFDSDDNINVEIIFLLNNKNNIELSEIYIEIIEKNKYEEVNKQNVIIFNVNNNNYPVYFNNYNILNFYENINQDKEGDNEIFFM